VYHKGAEVIRMLHTIIGPVTYRKTMDRFFAKHDG
jgi:aminopeptidase N